MKGDLLRRHRARLDGSAVGTLENSRNILGPPHGNWTRVLGLGYKMNFSHRVILIRPRRLNGTLAVVGTLASHVGGEVIRCLRDIENLAVAKGRGKNDAVFIDQCLAETYR